MPSMPQRCTLVLVVAASLAAAWLYVVVVPAALSKQHMEDFASVYLGAAMAWRGHWADLYPEPVPGAVFHAGRPESGSVMGPHYRRFAGEQGLLDYNRFGYAPPAALLFAPLGTTDYGTAQVVWVVLMAMLVLGVAGAAAKWCRVLWPATVWPAAFAMVLIAASPLAYRVLRTGNATPLVAMAVVLALWAAFRQRRAAAGGAAALGGVCKGTSAVLLPLLFVRGGWLCLVGFAAATLSVLAVTVAIMGIEPLVVFVHDISPTYVHTSAEVANQSLQAALLRWQGGRSLAEPARDFVQGLGAVVLLATIAGTVWRRHALDQPAVYCAAAAAALSTLIAFAPLGWVHYQLLLVPLWPWLIWEASTARGAARIVWAVVAAAIILPAWAPIVLWSEQAGRLPLPAPLRNLVTYATLMMLLAGLYRLARPLRAPARAGH